MRVDNPPHDKVPYCFPHLGQVSEVSAVEGGEDRENVCGMTLVDFIENVIEESHDSLKIHIRRILEHFGAEEAEEGIGTGFMEKHLEPQLPALRWTRGQGLGKKLCRKPVRGSVERLFGSIRKDG